MRLVDTEMPSGTTVVNRDCWVREADGECQVWLKWLLVLRFPCQDQAFRRLAAAILARTGAAAKTDIARGLGYHRNYVAELEARLEEDGLAGMVEAKRGPKGPHKVRPQMIRRARELRRQGMGLWAIASQLRQEFGTPISHTSVRRMVMGAEGKGEEGVQGTLDNPGPVALPLFRGLGEVPGEGGSAADAQGSPEDGEEPPVAAPEGEVALGAGEAEALPRPVVEEGRVFSNAGGFLLYPALAVMGLVEAFGQVYRPIAGRRYGLRELVLGLFFLWVLGFPSLEASKGAVRRDVGALIGARLAPALKALRRKLGEVAKLGQGYRLIQEMARRYGDKGMVELGVLYADGHVKPYYGSRSVGEVWSPQRRMPVPGIQQYFINDVQGRPLFFLTAQPHKSLTQMLPKLVEEVRSVIRERPFTLVFDRGGYSPRLFGELRQQGVHIITYRRKPFDPYPEEGFRQAVCELGGRQREFRLHEERVELKEAGPLRVIAIRRDNGRQTHILTTDWETEAARIACLMINRWGQENFFKYMLQHYALDALVGWGGNGVVEEAQVPNPRRQELDREIRRLRERIRGIKEQMGALAAERANRKGLRPLRQEVQGLEQALTARKRERTAVPKQVPVSQTGRQLDRLDLEKTALADTIKVAAYNAEAWLLERLDRYYQDPRDSREVLRILIRLKGRLWLRGTNLVVDLTPPETPRYRRALEGLCGELNQLATPFPGTSYQVQFAVAGTQVHTTPFSRRDAMS
ncbi:MAG: helix-turn-helix domain-containing protein [Chloroflexi bacterium]|nr:helix-turn-helix domain-containing protein [Chloroflexota bacterium]